MNEDALTHGEIVKRLIEDNHINISDMAKKTGINRTTIYSIMNHNQKKIKPDVCNKIADYFKISAEVFFEKPMNALEYSLYSPKFWLKDDEPWFNFKEPFEAFKRTYEFVHSALCLSGYNEFTLEDVRKMIDSNAIPEGYPMEFGWYITELLTMGCVVNKGELEFIRTYRGLDSEEQKTIQEVLFNFSIAHREKRRVHKANS